MSFSNPRLRARCRKDIKQKSTSVEALDRRVGPRITGSRAWDLKYSRELLEGVTRYDNCSLKGDGSDEPDPTWGWYVFLTYYSPAARHNVGRAIQNLLRMHHRDLGADADPPDVYADEAYRRLKLELVEDEALEDVEKYIELHGR